MDTSTHDPRIAALIQGEEAERRRIAREIHDGPAQLLVNVAMQLEICERLVDQDTQLLKQELRRLKDLVRRSVSDVRKVIYDLRPFTLDDSGIISAVRAYVDQFVKRTGVEVEIQASSRAQRYAPELEIGTYRIVQEGLNNIAKHAEASRVVVEMETGPEKIVAKITDDGKGFDVQAAHDSGFGLSGMSDRVKLLGGRLDVTSQPGAGTVVALMLPVNE